ncbi:MAG: hotdog family protein [Pseudomonadota bacterium]
MRVALEYSIEQILPHSGRMQLIDRAIEGDEESLVSELVIRDDNLFFDGASVGGWVGIEYMAQTVAAWAGWRARLLGESPKIGFLLGTRRYNCSRAAFHLGDTLRVEVRRHFQADNGLAQFDCKLEIDGATVATAALTVFEPEDADAFLKGQGNE